jgi:hypothetical protein
MKSITIHGLDEPLWKMIKAKSKYEGLSMNRTIKKILETAFGIKPKISQEREKEFKEFCGIWSKADASEFKKAVKDFEIVNKEDWK